MEIEYLKCNGFCGQLVLYIFVCWEIAVALVVNICALSDTPASLCYAKLLPTWETIIPQTVKVWELCHDQKVYVHLHLLVVWEIPILLNFSFYCKEWDAPKFCSHACSLLESNFQAAVNGMYREATEKIIYALYVQYTFSCSDKPYSIRYSNLKSAYGRKLNRHEGN